MCDSKRLCDDEKCQTCFEKSFASHEKAKFWSSCNEKGPEYYALNSHKKCWFDCDKCNHKFETKLNAVVSLNTWCPYCVNKKYV